MFRRNNKPGTLVEEQLKGELETAGFRFFDIGNGVSCQKREEYPIGDKTINYIIDVTFSPEQPTSSCLKVRLSNLMNTPGFLILLGNDQEGIPMDDFFEKMFHRGVGPQVEKLIRKYYVRTPSQFIRGVMGNEAVALPYLRKEKKA